MKIWYEKIILKLTTSLILAQLRGSVHEIWKQISLARRLESSFLCVWQQIQCHWIRELGVQNRCNCKNWNHNKSSSKQMMWGMCDLIQCFMFECSVPCCWRTNSGKRTSCRNILSLAFHPRPVWLLICWLFHILLHHLGSKKYLELELINLAKVYIVLLVWSAYFCGLWMWSLYMLVFGLMKWV